MNSGIVNNVWTKTVNTKYGEKGVTLFSLDGEDGTYNIGFGRVDLRVGDKITFEDSGFKYGEFQVDKNTVKVESRDNSVAAPTPTPAKTEPAKPAPSKGYSRGTFPLDFTDGQRSILRQHAFTQASEVYREAYRLEDGSDIDEDDLDKHVDQIIKLAYRIERYTSGDDLRDEMKEE